MQQEASRTSRDDVNNKECYVEHCSFPWKIRNFLAESNRSSNYLGTTLFSASNNDGSSTLWQLDLNTHGPQNEILIDLTRQTSQNKAFAFVRFHWNVLDVDGNKVFPGSIHAFAAPDEKLVRVFVPDSSLLVKERFYPSGCLRVLCELTVYGRTVEETISSSIRSEVPYQFCVLSEDLESLFVSESDPDLCVTSKEGVMHCHKSILSARSRVFADFLRSKEPEDCDLDLGEVRSDILHAILTFLYCGNIDMYLKYTIPRGLYSEAEKYGLTDLQDHLRVVDEYDLTTVKAIDVTWKLPRFNVLVLQPKVELYCPERNSNTFYDDRWCFKLEFDSSGDYASIWVIRKQDERSKHRVQFVVSIESGVSVYEKNTKLLFEVDGMQGMKDFIPKDTLKSLVSFQDILDIKCSLKVLHYERLSEDRRDSDNLLSAIEHFTKSTETSLMKLSVDLLDLYKSGDFGNAITQTSAGEIGYHSYIADARFRTTQEDLAYFLENISPSLVQPFFVFIYGAELSTGKASRLQRYAGRFGMQSIISKLSDLLAILPAGTDESGSSEDEDSGDITDAEDSSDVADAEDDDDIVDGGDNNDMADTEDSDDMADTEDSDHIADTEDSDHIVDTEDSNNTDKKDKDDDDVVDKPAMKVSGRRTAYKRKFRLIEYDPENC